MYIKRFTYHRGHVHDRYLSINALKKVIEDLGSTINPFISGIERTLGNDYLIKSIPIIENEMLR